MDRLGPLHGAAAWHLHIVPWRIRRRNLRTREPVLFRMRRLVGFPFRWIRALVPFRWIPALFPFRWILGLAMPSGVRRRVMTPMGSAGPDRTTAGRLRAGHR